jgi:FtsX-like permease family
MNAIALRVQVWVRRNLVRLVTTAMVIGLISGLVTGLAAGTRRTETAPDRSTAKAGGDPELAIQQQLGAPLSEQIATLPGVVSAKAVAFVPSFLVSPTDGSQLLEPNPFAGNEELFGVRVVKGRLPNPTAPDEFTVNRVYAAMLAKSFGTKVGDTFQIASFSQQQVDDRSFPGVPPSVPNFPATLVGITDRPGDFDDPSPSITYSPSFLAAHPTVGVVQTIISVRLDKETSPETVLDAVRAIPNGQDAFPIPTRLVSAEARRAVRFQVTALWLVTAVAALAAVAVLIQLVRRMLRVPDDEHMSLMALGWRPRDLATERALEGLIAAAIAVPIVALTSYGLTALFPLGVLRSFEPSVGPRIDWPITIVGIAAASAVVIVGAASAGLRRVRRGGGVVAGGQFARIVAAAGAGVPLATGARMLGTHRTDGRRSWGLYVAGALGVAGIVGSGVVGVSLTNVLDHPARWGRNYDALYGNPYISTPDDIVTPIAASPDVVAVSGATIGALAINGRDTAAYAFDAVRGGLVPTVIDGRVPSTADEIGLGAEVARRLHVRVGDEVEATGPTGNTRQLRVVGITTTFSDVGAGVAVTFDGYQALSPTATKNIAVVNFRRGTPADVKERLGEANFTPLDQTFTLPPPVRALERVTAAPYLLTIVLGVLLLLACAYVLPLAVRARRHDLAVLRALGSDGRQLRGIVHWQSTLAGAIVLVVGVPIGIVFGRWIVELLTSALGIAPGASVPLALVGVLVVGALLAANLLAIVPARGATRATVRLLTKDR